MRGFVDRNGREVGDYKQRRRAAGGSWTGSPGRPKPRQVGPKTNQAGQWRNVAQTVRLPRGRPKPEPSWREKEDRDRRPAVLAWSGAVTGFSGVIVTATAAGLLVVLGVFVALLGTAFGVASLALRIRAAQQERPPCPIHSTGYSPKCATCRARYDKR